MIGIVVDSTSQLPDELAERYGIVVVPLVVSVDGTQHLEGVDLGADEFYAAWTDEHTPTIETSQPSPGAFAHAYQGLVDRGCTEILSVHVAESMSGTLNSARLGAQEVDAEVRLVDSGTASFGVSCCAWAAADAIAQGADLEAAASVAASCAAGLRTSFVVGVPQLMERSGRAGDVDIDTAGGEGIAVVAYSGSDLAVLATVTELDDAVQAMVDDALAWGRRDPTGARIAIGTSDASSVPVARGLTNALDGHPEVAEVLHYRIGPSVGAHTGPGTAGLFVF